MCRAVPAPTSQKWCGYFHVGCGGGRGAAPRMENYGFTYFMNFFTESPALLQPIFGLRTDSTIRKWKIHHCFESDLIKLKQTKWRRLCALRRTNSMDCNNLIFLASLSVWKLALLFDTCVPPTRARDSCYNFFTKAHWIESNKMKRWLWAL